uniref:hypothetical protein n=1 Tax=Paractinoplanes polyasparticus TaxID=2856853 RepID=UPI001C866442|nr:hypothetical protein [Actinoplanes polyasparticus]
MRSTLAIAMILLVTLGFATPAAAAADWVTIGSDRARALDESQGLTVIRRNGTVEYRYTGVGTIPAGVSSRGYDHVGDPDSVSGWYVEPYQRTDRNGKMFRVQSPSGAWSEYFHPLSAGIGEAHNNSWTAITPDGLWMLSGEWGTMTRLLGFATPGLNPAASTTLPLAFTVQLDRPMRDIQGCDFSSATTLLCASDDPTATLFGISKPLLQIDLAHTPEGADLTGRVTALRQLPLSSGCTGKFEVQGIDHQQDGTLRAIVMSPSVCVIIDSKTWRLRKA